MILFLSCLSGNDEFIEEGRCVELDLGFAVS